MKPVIPLLFAFAFLVVSEGQAQVDPDPNGVLLNPIPDRLMVLTFDDAPASHATVVAPILKEMGLGGTIYVCDFDSFKTRKDWYLTYRQMNAMHADGLEIGNHTLGHASGYGPVIAMEDQVLAHGGPKMTTVCWPIYNVNWNDCPKLSAQGYTFGRGGHERPYRPTVDNPFDVPSFTIRDGIAVESFAEKARLACQGRVVVFCFHGVPDMEHPGVSLEPATFKAMMRYLKDNNYQCIAMRDLAKYINPLFPRLRSGHRLFQRPSPKKQFPSIRAPGHSHSGHQLAATHWEANQSQTDEHQCAGSWFWDTYHLKVGPGANCAFQCDELTRKCGVRTSSCGARFRYNNSPHRDVGTSRERVVNKPEDIVCTGSIGEKHLHR
jgi:hypothetical protein